MSSSDASDELRMLRAKAYGPGEGVSDAELARLRELEGPRHPSVAPLESEQASEQVPEPGPRAPEAPGRAERGSEWDGGIEGVGISVPDASTGSASGNSGSASGTSARRRWPLLLAASITALAIGLGIGWGVWGWDSHASALAAAHADTQADLEAEELYDPGTIVPVAEHYGLVIWRADRSDGEEVCVIITASEQKPHGCVSYEQLAESAWPSATGRIPEGEAQAGQTAVAGLIPTTTGDLVPFVQVWDTAVSNWESQYSEEELRQLREIEAEGHMASALSIVGYDGDTAVWSTWETGGFCVLVSGDAGVAQACTEEAMGSVSVTAPVGGMSTRYVVTQTERRGPQLTIYKDVDTDYYFGSGDDPQFDDLFPDGSGTDSPELDDKTGP